MAGTSIRAGAFLLITALTALGDEGMWLFTKPPVKQVKDSYGFEIKQEWLDHLQKSSVHFGGGSGSFVSPDGLILTNHHVGAGHLEKLSTPEHDYLKNGFYAPTLAEEMSCRDLELNVLVSIEDVTARVNAAVAGTKDAAVASTARSGVIATIERESLAATGLRSDVITLYHGGAYHLYRYKRYTDVRLVFAPEKQAGAFGGDPDNFEFPRYCLDLCFFRVYEDGKPAKTPDYLKWSKTGAREGDLIFVSGHPGHTNREDTLAEVTSARDEGLPRRLDSMLRSEALMSIWASREEENFRRASGLITGIQNGRKATAAKLEGLLDPEFIAAKTASEKAMRDAFLAEPRWKDAAAAFDEIAKAQAEHKPISNRSRMLEGGEAFNTSLFSIARTLVRVREENPKPDDKRLHEFRTAARPSLELGLFSTRPIYKDLETEKLANSLTQLCAVLGVDDPLVVKIMAGKAPHERAAELVNGTKLEMVELRHKFYDEGGLTSGDPMIQLAILVDSEARALRKQGDAIGERITQASQRIATARFALEGDSSYPDATGTLRLSYGTVKGYETAEGKVAWCTTLAGLFEKSVSQHARVPYQLPVAWAGKKEAFKGDTPFNFISTADIIGGNSGSPVVNKEGELVGLIFDGNAPSLTLGYGYSDKTARAVSVHSAGMLEALDKIYKADRLVQEIRH